MKIHEFLQLGMVEQVDLLYDRGSFLAKRKTLSGTNILYQLDGFYVEIIYRKYRQVIDELLITASTDVLDPYLDPIDVEELMNI